MHYDDNLRRECERPDLNRDESPHEILSHAAASPMAPQPPPLAAASDKEGAGNSTTSHESTTKSATGDTVGAGRQLDARVARAVMGLVVCNSPRSLQLPARCDLYGVEHLAIDEVEPYSTDIAAAFKVVDFIHARGTGWLFSKRSRFYLALADLCTVDATPAFPQRGLVSEAEFEFRTAFVAWPDALGIFRAQLPEFICRAALAAVEGR